MTFPHWLMIGGALLVFVGLVGAALQRRPAAANPSESKVAEEQPAAPLPKSLDRAAGSLSGEASPVEIRVSRPSQIE